MIPKVPKQTSTRAALSLGEFKQPELVIFDEYPRTATAFPRAHLVSAEVVSSERIEFDFRTHVVTVTAPDADAVYDEVLAGEVCVLTKLKGYNRDTHCRSVQDIDVRSTGATSTTDDAKDTTAEITK